MLESLFTYGHPIHPYIATYSGTHCECLDYLHQYTSINEKDDRFANTPVSHFRSKKFIYKINLKTNLNKAK